MAKTISAAENNERPPVNVNVLTDHYQKTFEVAYDYWKERNKLFVFLVLAAGLGLMLLLRIPTTDALLVAAITKFLNITDETLKANLQTSFPFNILLSGILIVMFYFMQRLYSTNLSVMRNFLYLGALEKEIRKHLNLSTDSIAFTREGSFYWGKRMVMQTASKWYYIFVLFIILIPFIVLKLRSDLQTLNWLILLADFTVSLITVMYWGEYAYSAIKLDAPKVLVEQSKK
jgi:hypothetical protein